MAEQTFNIIDKSTIEYAGKTWTYDNKRDTWRDRSGSPLFPYVSPEKNTNLTKILKSLVDKGVTGEQTITTGEKVGGNAGRHVFEVNGTNMFVKDGKVYDRFINNEDYIGKVSSDDFVYNGKSYSMKFTGDGLNRNQAAVLEYFKKYGEMPTDKSELDIAGERNFSKAVTAVKNWLKDEGIYDSYMEDFKTTGGFTKETPIIDPATGEELDPNSDRAKQLRLDEARDVAYNNYWNNIYDRNRSGSLGQEAYNEMLTAERNAAQDNIDLANAQVQQLGMAQAQTVKNITDQLRAERMSMLRAGMSESQIANQDMQQMIANTNALNDQIAAANMGVLQGRQQYRNAEQTAYQNWLNSMNAVGTNASAMAAADTGDPYMQTLKRMKQTGESYKAANNYITGQTNNTTR